MNIIESLKDFTGIAEKNRKYPKNTADGRRAAIKLIEPVLNDSERESLDSLKANIEQIFLSVYNANKEKFSANTIQEYKKRLKRTIYEYETYGLDPSKMASWSVIARKISPKRKEASKSSADEEPASNPNLIAKEQVDNLPSMNRTELTLRPNVKAIIITPSDLTQKEAEKLKTYFDFLLSYSKNTEN